ncbi:MAG: hypothetical protein ABL925_03105 [Methylococcales bacterium]
MHNPLDSRLPRQVLLFSGHMIDAPNGKIPRFPADKESIAAEKIAAVLDKLGANAEDLALTQGANGGDIVFAEACLQRGVKLLQRYGKQTFTRISIKDR